MKRSILTLGIVLAIFASCSNIVDDPVAQTPQQEEENKNSDELHRLQGQIVQLTDEWQKQEPIRLTRAGIGDEYTMPEKVVTQLNVTGADLLGAYIGSCFGPWWGLAYGALASVVAYHEVKHSRFPMLGISGIDSESLVLVNKKNPTALDSIGYYHNMIIKNIGEDNIEEASSAELEGLVVNSMKELFGAEAEVVTVEKLRADSKLQFVRSNAPALVKSKNIDEYCKIISNCNQISKAELNVFKEYLKGLSVVDNSNANYSKAVTNAIDDSDLDPATKERLKGGIAVGNASQKLWTIE